MSTGVGGESSPATKKLCSQPSDVIVAVGSGDKMEEFECYRVVLSFASEYFDTMPSASMRENEHSRIGFPDKDPEEWKLFCTFIDHSTSRDEARISGNAMTLLPWFHEFQMNKLIKECDEDPTTEAEHLEPKRHHFENFWKGKDIYGLQTIYELQLRWRSRHFKEILWWLLSASNMFDLPPK